MHAVGVARLDGKSIYRLALRLRDIGDASRIAFAVENAKSGRAIERAIKEIKQSVGRIAGFINDPSNRQAVDAVGDAAARWRAKQNGERVQGFFDPPLTRDNEVIHYFGRHFTRKWFEAAQFMREILEDEQINIRNIDDLDWPREITDLQGRTLPELFKRTYPRTGFGGKAGDQPQGPGYTFVAASMEALGHARPAPETIRSAKRKMRQVKG